MITETVSKACPICGGQVCMVPTSRAYGFWCDECATMYAITELDLQKMCKRWWENGCEPDAEA